MRTFRPWMVTAALLCGLAATSCSKSSPTSPAPDPPPGDPGDLRVISTPSGAAIFLDGTATGRLTPDTLRQVAAGSRQVAIKLAHFADTTVTVQVPAAGSGSVTVSLRYVQTYFPPTIGFSRSTIQSSEGLGTRGVADFNGDGRADLLGDGNSGTGEFVRVFAGAGNGTFTLLGTVIDTTADIWGATVGHFNHDAIPDVAVLVRYFSESDLLVYLGNGDGTFRGTGTRHTTINPLGREAGELYGADVSGDGVSDLLLGYTTGSRTLALGIWMGNGDGSIQPVVEYSRSFAQYEVYGPSDLVVADLTGDGISDVAEAMSTLEGGPGGIVLWAGAGGGALRSDPPFISTGGITVDLGTGDFNRDGKQDLVAANSGGGSGLGTAVVLLARSGGVFEAPIAYRTGLSSGGVAIADFNGDGYADLAVVDGDSAGLTLLSGLGDGVFQPAGSVATTPHPGRCALSDFNGDGRPDLVLANTNGGNPATLDVLLGQ